MAVSYTRAGIWRRQPPFYRDVFGLVQPAPPIPPNPAVQALIGAPGARLEVQVFRIPSAAFGWGFTHFGSIDLKRVLRGAKALHGNGLFRVSIMIGGKW